MLSFTIGICAIICLLLFQLDCLIITLRLQDCKRVTYVYVLHVVWYLDLGLNSLNWNSSILVPPYSLNVIPMQYIHCHWYLQKSGWQSTAFFTQWCLQQPTGTAVFVSKWKHCSNIGRCVICFLCWQNAFHPAFGLIRRSVKNSQRFALQSPELFTR